MIGAETTRQSPRGSTGTLDLRAPNLPKSSPNGVKREPGGRQNRKIMETQQKRREKTRAFFAVPPFFSKKWPTWLQLGPQDGAKIAQKSIQKPIKKTMHLGIDFWKDFGAFLEEKWRHVGTKIEQKSMPTSKSDFLKKPCFSLGKTMILRVQGIEVGGKNQ